jgi:hypothetical protein
MEYETGWGDRERKRYLLSNLVELVDGMCPHTREWLITVLAEISREQFLTDLSTDELFSCYDSLNVGPLRTEFLGVFACHSQSEAFAIIKQAVVFDDEDLNAAACFPDVLLPLDSNMLRASFSSKTI